jgi:LacI family transcriptional regulator
MNTINEQAKIPPTVRELAKRAGVSVGTVSRVLNEAGNVDPEIRRRTLEVIKSSGYELAPRGRRNYHLAAAKARSPKASDRNILLLAPEMSPSWSGHELWEHFIAGVKRACEERDYSYLVGMSDSFKDSIRKLLGPERIACGAILKMNGEPPRELLDAGLELPLVGFGSYHPECPIPQVAIDDYSAGTCAALAALALGHKRVAFVNPARRRTLFINRSLGYSSAMKTAGLFDPSLLIELDCDGGSKSPQGAPPDMREALRRLLDARASAAIFANDWSALGFYRAAQDAGVRIPDDIGVMGFDDTKLCQVVSPALSSMSMPFEEEAYFAASTLIDVVEGASRRLLGRSR